MNTHRCCEKIEVGLCGGNVRKPGLGNTIYRKVLDLFRWLVPGTILLLLPKCPACFAAYFAIGTGIGISFSTAASIKMLLATLCIASLCFFTVKRLMRLRGTL